MGHRGEKAANGTRLGCSIALFMWKVDAMRDTDAGPYLDENRLALGQSSCNRHINLVKGIFKAGDGGLMTGHLSQHSAWENEESQGGCPVNCRVLNGLHTASMVNQDCSCRVL